MRVGINGIGIAGPTLAYWLRELGHEPVLFERSSRLRAEGFVVDFWGHGYEIAERMGLIDELRSKATEMQSLSFVDDAGSEIVSLDTQKVREAWNDRFITVPRGVICEAAFDACEGIRAELGTHIVGVEDRGDAVVAELSTGREETFDAVVGADGLHSAVREQVFGPEDRFEKFLDCYVAAYRAESYPHHDPTKYVAHSIPERWAARIQRFDGTTVVLLIFRASRIDGDPSPEDVPGVLREVYADVGWEVPEMLRHLDEGPVYFDRVSQIHMPAWSKGRVALAGDAAACASLLAGEGTSLAMLEAYVLAGELHRADGDVETGFRAYHQALADHVARAQKSALTYRGFFAPQTAFGVTMRNALCRIASLPGVTKLAAGRATTPFELEDYAAA